MRAYLKTKMLEIHRWMFRLAMSYEIIFPSNWFIIFFAAFYSTRPIDLTTFMYGFEVTLQDAVVNEALLANIATVAREFIMARACRCFG